jgi:hypothetical protein
MQRELPYRKINISRMFIIKLSMGLFLQPAQLANAQNTHFTNSYGSMGSMVGGITGIAGAGQEPMRGWHNDGTQKGGNKRSNKKRSNKKRSKRSKRSKSGGQPISLNFGLGSRTPLPPNLSGAANPPPIMYVKNTCAK